MSDKKTHKINPLSAPGRRSPKQERSRKTVEAILSSALRILEEEGFSGVTMQKIANGAGINVAAVYGYFPNKYQVVAEISDRMFFVRYELRKHHYDRLLELDGDWVDNFADSAREVAKWRQTEFGMAVLRNAMRSSPILMRLSRQNFDQAAQQLTEFLNKVDPDFEGDQHVRARVIAESFNAVLDLLETYEGTLPDGILDETIEMIRRYLKGG
ncbi:MAG: TetR/AcrR family transcriptional regulator [Pseudomonadota bacterium]